MSHSGFPKEYSATVASTLAVRSTVDVCKGCRKCCQSLTKMIANTRELAMGCISLPIVIMIVFLIYLETSVDVFIEDKLIPYQIQLFRQYKPTLFSPFYILSSITFSFGILAMIAIKCEFQNILRFCAFVYRGIAHWILLSVFLLIGPIAGYLPLYMIFQIICWSLIPSSLWLFTAGVMTAHSDLITAAIDARGLVMNQVDQQLSV